MEKVCPIPNDLSIDNSPKAYACFNRNENIRKESSSGGVFTLLASYVIDCGGVVYGAAFSDDFQVKQFQLQKKKSYIY